MKTIRIKDYYGIYQEIPVEDHIYEAWKDMQREENSLHKRTVYHGCTVALEDIEEMSYTGGIDALVDDMIRNEEVRCLYAAIEKLTPIQRKRIMMLLDDMSCTEIARAEGKDHSVISRSIGKALLNLRKLMEN